MGFQVTAVVEAQLEPRQERLMGTLWVLQLRLLAIVVVDLTVILKAVASRKRLLEVAVEVLVLVMAMAQVVVVVLMEEAQAMLLGPPQANLLVPQLELELVLELGLSWLAVMMGLGGMEVVGTQVMVEAKEVVVEVKEVVVELKEVVVEVLQELLRVIVRVVKMVQELQQKE